GVVGPASGARELQKFFHRATSSRDPQGWDHQLRNELGVNVNYQHTWRAANLASGNGLAVDFSPQLGGALGNVETYANAGFKLRFGRHLPNDYGPPRIDPGLPGSGYFVPSSDFRWYLFAGAEGRLVARNIFLDGNTFHDSPSVDKKNWVGDFQAGLAMSW